MAGDHWKTMSLMGTPGKQAKAHRNEAGFDPWTSLVRWFFLNAVMWAGLMIDGLVAYGCRMPEGT